MLRWLHPGPEGGIRIHLMFTEICQVKEVAFRNEGAFLPTFVLVRYNRPLCVHIVPPGLFDGATCRDASLDEGPSVGIKCIRTLGSCLTQPGVVELQGRGSFISTNCIGTLSLMCRSLLHFLAWSRSLRAPAHLYTPVLELRCGHQRRALHGGTQLAVSTAVMTEARQ